MIFIFGYRGNYCSTHTSKLEMVQHFLRSCRYILKALQLISEINCMIQHFTLRAKSPESEVHLVTSTPKLSKWITGPSVVPAIWMAAQPGGPRLLRPLHPTWTAPTNWLSAWSWSENAVLLNRKMRSFGLPSLCVCLCMCAYYTYYCQDRHARIVACHLIFESYSLQASSMRLHLNLWNMSIEILCR